MPNRKNKTPQPGERRVILVRHTAIDAAYNGICYGRTDVALSPEGIEAIGPLAIELAHARPTALFHSDLTRTTALATRLAHECSQALTADERLRELDFGDWEQRSWDDIHTRDKVDIARLIHEPHTFAPPAGETVIDLRNRVLAWYRSLPPLGTVIAVTHGGPISVLRGTLSNAPVAEWPTLVPPYGSITELP
ncbi:MAG TPA: histidine phosphatase family protein [Hyphomicrobiaceae bacterium]|nr:histidine phosphatase family protein [Hyphomicrobiaceae bacterium]